jgi:hypothetical protein
VEVRQASNRVTIQDVTTSRSWSYLSSTVGKVEFRGGAGNDRFVNTVANLPVLAFGAGGHDYLAGRDGADYFDGGSGDDAILGYGGNDVMFGGPGNDNLQGMNGDDQLHGQEGNDRLNGGAGNDKMWGDSGDDVLIAIDGATGDQVQDDSGDDVLWVDLNRPAADRVSGLAAGDAVQYVDGFANGADRTLNGDRIADPRLESGLKYKAFWSKPLFSSAGPRPTDVRQGQLGDCYLMAGLAAVALDSPDVIRQRVVEFDDGTYGVRLGSRFYRVDNDLPVSSSSSTSPEYANLGRDNSLWVAAVEKAFAHYRTGANSYASLERGWPVEVNRAFNAKSPGEQSIASYANATQLANHVFDLWHHYQAVTVGFQGLKAGSVGAPLITGHAYTVMSFVRNVSGLITGITLRNPWGRDGAGHDTNPNDGLVTVTPQQIFAYIGRVNWGRV